MRYHNITKSDMLNGEGLRVVLWVSHCEHACKGCQNPQTWSAKGGIEFDLSAIIELFEELNKPHIQGITFSGGDPLSHINRETITVLAKTIKAVFPSKDIWLYTGYEWNDVKDLEIVKYLDVLVDGKYVEALNRPSPEWCGSTNQKVIDVPKSIETGTIVLYRN